MAQSLDAAQLIADDKKYVWHHLTQHKVFEKSDPTIFVEGKGMRIKDIHGKEYLDAVSGGVWTVNLGYANETLAKAGIPHYTGADSFALNGAFLGYGVDYANLGVDTANMVSGILLDGNKPATTPVLTFDNGTATINTETCAGLGLDFDALSQAFAPYCTKIATLTTAESFS